MATRKKTTRKKAGRKKITRKALIKEIDKELAGLSKAVDKRLAPLLKEIDKAERQAGSEGARLLREARKRLNRVEIKGKSDWTQFLKKSQRELSGVLTDLERTVRPKRKKTTKKKTKKKTARRKTR